MYILYTLYIIYTLISYLCMSKLFPDVFAEAMEEIMVEDEADLQQLVGSEVVVLELSAQVLF